MEEAMARLTEWQHELADSRRREDWSLHGPKRIVKITQSALPLASSLRGFFCLEKSLLGATPSALEQRLGFRTGFLSKGCRVYRFLRLPMQGEVEYELTTRYPNGLAFNAAMGDPTYPAGSGAVHQWKLLVDLPVVCVLTLAPGQPYPYMHA